MKGRRGPRTRTRLPPAAPLLERESQFHKLDVRDGEVGPTSAKGIRKTHLSAAKMNTLPPLQPSRACQSSSQLRIENEHKEIRRTLG